MIELHQIEAIIFDMDGLMLDTERISLACWQQAAEAHGYQLDPAIGIGMVGLNSRDSARWIRETLGDDFPVDRINDTSRQLYLEAFERGIPTKSGLFELLDWLDEAGIPKAVATSTRRSFAEKKLGQVGILQRFQHTVCGDEVTQGKPAPEIFLRAAAGLGVDAATCLVLEDSDPGVRGALAAGMRVIQVPDIRPPHAEVRAFGHPIMASLDAVLAALKQSRG